MDLNYRVIRSARKTISLELTQEGELVVRCPRRMKEGDIRRFVESKRAWIEKHLSRRAAQPQLPPLTAEELRRLADLAAARIPGRVAHFAPLVGVSYGRITIRSQHTRWGSCSSLGNLNFNCLLMLAPPEVLDYVVVHELCHRKEMNHSSRFWSEVARVMPEYKAQLTWLKTNGTALLGRLPEEKIMP